MKARLLAALAAIVVVAAGAIAQEPPIPPAPTRWVTDTVQFLSPQTVQALDRQLEAYERQSGHQLLVYIGQTTGIVPIEDWAVRTFEQWQVGRQGMDDGLVLFVMAEDRRLRIEVGYGLEGDVPDVIALRIINEVIVPRIQAGNPDEAIATGMEAIVMAIGGEGFGDLTAPAPGEGAANAGERKIGIGQLILFGILALGFLILLATNPTLAIFLLMNILSSGHGRRGGGGFGGGGGFRGGGGRSGGGGASGSW